MKRLLLACLFAVTASPALAATVADGRAHLDAGNYAAAVQTGRYVDTVDGALLAAEAMGAQIMLNRVEAKDTAKAALELLDGVLEAEPGNTEALFLRALHQGFRTRSASKLAIVMGGLIGRTEDRIEAFAAAAPGDPRADALRGAWHLGIVRAAGDGRFGASLEAGLARYDAAVSAMPDDIVVMSNYAFSLIVMDDAGLRPRAKTLLDRIADTPATDAIGRETKARMMRLRDAWDDTAAVRELARDLLNTEEVG